ncbi:MAG: hypothetical protein IPO27_02330 [Bacteroidetes bacterium]|nr:hypothetical protein [Bacteroidota bacterium]
MEDSTNMGTTKIHVAHTDILILQSSPAMNTFYMQLLAADNKLYVITQAYYKAMNVINQPDSLGLACDVQQHGLPLLKLNQRSCPNWANYDLGPVLGSVCDSLGLGVTPTAVLQDLRISPNPAM